MTRALARVGTTLHAKWRLDSLLGVGGTAAVYAATHRNGSRAAVKILNPELSFNSQVRERFFREGYAANAVGHEGTVKVIDDDEALDGSLFLVTELLDGEPLEERRVRAGGRLGEAEVLWLTDQLLDVIASAHDKGIVHRDLKPENVFLTRGGQLKVLDFGIAALREVSAGRRGTLTGAVMGTPAYMPPEQALGLWERVDAQSDLWAWGATMFHLLSGQVVHDGRTPNEQLSKAISEAAPPLASVAPDVSLAVARIVDRALERDKEKRWQDARSMQEGVRHAYLDRNAAPEAALADVSIPPPSAQGERRSTPTFRATAMPVEGTASIPPHSTPGRRRRVVLVLVAAAPLLAAAMFVRSFVATGPSGSAALDGAATTRAVGAPPSVAAAPPPPEGAMEGTPQGEPRDAAPSEAESIPFPSPPVSTEPAHATPAPRSSAPAKGAAKPSCNPPYVVEPDTGKRRWKLECL